MLEAGGELTELRSVGPWVAEKLTDWIEHPPAVPEPDPNRRGFITYAQVRAALEADPTLGGDARTAISRCTRPRPTARSTCPTWSQRRAPRG